VDRLRPIPLAEDIVIHARQELVRRLDSYELEHTDLFAQVVDLIEHKFMSIIRRHALSGQAHVNSEDPLLHNPLALMMLIDIFSERGFHAVVDKHIHEIPKQLDTVSGRIELREKTVYRVLIHFKGSEIRRG
jgi:adenylate kinase